MEKQIESQTNKVGNFFIKMDYRIAIFSLLFLVIGFIAGSHFHRGPHHMLCGQFHREQPHMKERAPLFDRGKGEGEPPTRKHYNSESNKGMEARGEKKPNEERPPAVEKSSDNSEQKIS